MKLKVILIALLLCAGQSLVAWAQTDSRSFIVRHVVLETDPNPRFIRRIAEMGIPWSQVATRDDVNCIKERLKDTGLFRGISSRLHKLKDSNGYELVLTIEFESANPVYKLKKAEVEDLEGVDNATLTNLLVSEGLMGQPLSLKTADYAVFEERLLELLRKSIADDEQREWRKLPWLDLRLDTNKELEIRIFREGKGCPSSSS
ncbi:MAG: hypothetical protein ACK4S4_13430 [Pyrinomonadaceae bacterium]